LSYELFQKFLYTFHYLSTTGKQVGADLDGTGSNEESKYS